MRDKMEFTKEEKKRIKLEEEAAITYSEQGEHN